MVGILLGRGAVQLVTQTINDLFFVVSVREMDVQAITLLKGAVTGIIASLLAAVVPAFEATSVSPAGALKRSNVEERARAALPWVSGAALGLLAVGAILLVPDWNLVVAFGGLFAVIVGSALLTPLLTLGLMSGVQWIADRHAGIIGRMAPRYVTRSLEPHLGCRRRPHGLSQRNHWCWHYDRQLSHHGQAMAKRRPAS